MCVTVTAHYLFQILHFSVPTAGDRSVPWPEYETSTKTYEEKTDNNFICIYSVPTAGDRSLPWPEYETNTKMYLDMDEDFSIKQHAKCKAVKFWTQDLPKPDLRTDFPLNKKHDEL